VGSFVDFEFNTVTMTLDLRAIVANFKAKKDRGIVDCNEIEQVFSDSEKEIKE